MSFNNRINLGLIESCRRWRQHFLLEIPTICLAVLSFCKRILVSKHNNGIWQLFQIPYSNMLGPLVVDLVMGLEELDMGGSERG